MSWARGRFIKVNDFWSHGGETIEVWLVGDNYDEAAAEVTRLCIKRK